MTKCASSVGRTATTWALCSVKNGERAGSIGHAFDPALVCAFASPGFVDDRRQDVRRDGVVLDCDGMASVIRQVVIDCRDPDRVARFWEQVLGWSAHVGRDCLWMSASGQSSPPEMLLVFVEVPEEKIGKNRVHLDLIPKGCAQDDEVRRLIALGARPVDVGQRGRPWVVLCDPEGNEFCVLRRRLD